MFWSKLNFAAVGLLLLLFMISRTSLALEPFTDYQCLENSSKISISHKSIPFGLTENIIKVEKKKCVIKINYERFRFLKNEWIIDICRGPIHIKKGVGSIDVIKREGNCQKAEFHGSSFCQEWKKLKQIIQDDGLIFAEGEKEELTSDHGKIFCSYLLLKKYLQDGVIFSRGERLNNLLKKDPTPFPDEENLPPKETKPAASAPATAPAGNKSLEVAPVQAAPEGSPTPESLKF